MPTDRLREWLDEPEDAEDPQRAFAALRAVVELHRPSHKWPSGVRLCLQCENSEWPCPTIRAIEGKVLK
jgi:hypothetical protein